MKVKKRDESSEGWSTDKLVASISKTGVPVDASEKIASSVEAWAKENAEGEEIESVKLRDKVAELLKADDYPAEADSYLAYKKG